MQIIINADDYGNSIGTSNAIVAAFSNGFCSSATIMANGNAFEEAVALAKSNGFADKIGIHLNLTDGRPISELIRRQGNFCNQEGSFNAKFSLVALNPIGLSREEQQAVACELRAQIEKCINAGLILSHADSHHHIHTRWEIWRILSLVLKDYGISKVRLSRNCGPKISVAKRVYKYLYNRNIRQNGYKTADCFGTVNDVAEMLSAGAINKKPGLVEVMVHPVYSETMELLDTDVNLAAAIGRIPDWQTAIAYSQCLP